MFDQTTEYLGGKEHPARHYCISRKHDTICAEGTSIIFYPLSMRNVLMLEQVIVAMSNMYKLEEFSESDLLVNITHHTLVPRHEVLSPEQKKNLLER